MCEFISCHNCLEDVLDLWSQSKILSICSSVSVVTASYKNILLDNSVKVFFQNIFNDVFFNVTTKKHLICIRQKLKPLARHRIYIKNSILTLCQHPRRNVHAHTETCVFKHMTVHSQQSERMQSAEGHFGDATQGVVAQDSASVKIMTCVILGSTQAGIKGPGLGLTEW